MSETGYNSDLEENIKDILNPKQKKLRKKRKNRTRINKKDSFKTKTKKQVINPTIPLEYKDSIYYNTKKFDSITKHILDSNLLDTTNSDSTVDRELSKIVSTEINSSSIKNNSSSKEVSITVKKNIINGKTHEEVKITEDNSSSPYIKEYTYINGKKKVTKIKK
jgi:ribosomal protein S19